MIKELRKHLNLGRGGERGQALVETALTLPVLLLLLVGAAELARVAYASIEVSNAARAAAQYGAMNGGGFKDATGMLAAANNDAANLTPAVTFNPAPSYACVCSDGSASTCGSGDCATSKMIITLTVNTQQTFTSIFRLPGLPITYTLHGTAVQKVLQ